MEGSPITLAARARRAIVLSGAAVGLATVLLSRGKEVELRQGSTIDVVFDRAVPVE